MAHAQRSYYLTNPGRLARKDNTLVFHPAAPPGEAPPPPRHVPVEGVTDLYVFSPMDLNTALLHFLGQQQICLHLFDYHHNYTGTFTPRDYLHAGQVLVAQARHARGPKRRLVLARQLLRGAAGNMLRNLRYYHNRGKAGLQEPICAILDLAQGLPAQPDVPSLMGLEGNIRQHYYSAFPAIVGPAFPFQGRSRRPPQNELNALISFLNSLTYTECLRALHHTQLHSTLSFLHEPGYRRHSLALDLAEVFKPLLADRLIFRLINRNQIAPKDFETDSGGILLRPHALRTVVQEWDARLATTIRHRTLGRQVSYRGLIRLEAHKLTKHILGIEPYKPFLIWW
jgi:CRISPR-associated protein Cas1